MIGDRMRIRRVAPEQLIERIGQTTRDVFELSSMGIPDVSVRDWTWK